MKLIYRCGLVDWNVKTGGKMEERTGKMEVEIKIHAPAG
jgi:hypothetical protein